MTEDTREILSLTDEEDDDEFDQVTNNSNEVSGVLSKWTNYIHGWQDRYVVLKDGTLSYYKSETETAFGCRGAVSLSKAVISPHEFDECRFDVTVSDCLWYLRAENRDERQHWIELIEQHKQVESGYGSENNLKRQNSLISLTSAASIASASSFKRGRGLREKLAEMDTFRDILCRQVDTLQNYFDACSAALTKQSSSRDSIDEIDDADDFDPPKLNVFVRGHHRSASSGSGFSTASGKQFMTLDERNHEKDLINILEQHGAHAIDFKGEAYTFKATTAGILSTLSHCIELMVQREESWRKRVEREVDKRKKIEDSYKALLKEQPKATILGGPDYEEGPHCKINDEEFFDAVDAALDKAEKEDEFRKLNKSDKLSVPPVLTSLQQSHPLYDEINKVLDEHFKHLDVTLDDTWELIAEDGEMKVFKMEVIEDGVVIDPLKAVHTVKGITGREICHYFWSPEYRMEWEGTLDSSTTLEWVSADTVISYQVHKKVWPASQRDSLFWSTVRHRPCENDSEGPGYWIVCNHTVPSHPKFTPNSKCVRITFNVAMICQTLVNPPKNGREISRDDITCKIQYSAKVNPGGWVPSGAVRLLSKRELPRFLKRMVQYTEEKTTGLPINL